MNISFANNEYHCDNTTGEYFAVAGQSTHPSNSDTLFKFQSELNFQWHTLGNLGNIGQYAKPDINLQSAAYQKTIEFEDTINIVDNSSKCLMFAPGTAYSDVRGICFVNGNDRRIFINNYNLRPFIIGYNVAGENFYPTSGYRNRDIFIDWKSVRLTFEENRWNEERTQIERTYTLAGDWQTLVNINYTFPNQLQTIDDRPFFAMGEVEMGYNHSGTWNITQNPAVLSYTDYRTDTIACLFVKGDDNTTFSDSNNKIAIKHFAQNINVVLDDETNLYVTMTGRLEFDYLGLE